MHRSIVGDRRRRRARTGHTIDHGLPFAAFFALSYRGFPFADEVFDFIAAHDRVFVVEQNRDAQLRTLLINEGGVDPARLVKVLNYDGSPITARFIQAELARGMGAVDANSAGEMAQ